MRCILLAIEMDKNAKNKDVKNSKTNPISCVLGLKIRGV